MASKLTPENFDQHYATAMRNRDISQLSQAKRIMTGELERFEGLQRWASRWKEYSDVEPVDYIDNMVRDLLISLDTIKALIEGMKTANKRGRDNV